MSYQLRADFNFIFIATFAHLLLFPDFYAFLTLSYLSLFISSSWLTLNYRLPIRVPNGSIWTLDFLPDSALAYAYSSVPSSPRDTRYTRATIVYLLTLETGLNWSALHFHSSFPALPRSAYSTLLISSFLTLQFPHRASRSNYRLSISASTAFLCSYFSDFLTFLAYCFINN